MNSISETKERGKEAAGRLQVRRPPDYTAERTSVLNTNSLHSSLIVSHFSAWMTVSARELIIIIILESPASSGLFTRKFRLPILFRLSILADLVPGSQQMGGKEKSLMNLWKPFTVRVTNHPARAGQTKTIFALLSVSRVYISIPSPQCQPFFCSFTVLGFFRRRWRDRNRRSDPFTYYLPKS